MQEAIATLSELGTGQRVRLTVGDAGPIELRANQKEYLPDDCLRLELTSDDSGDNGRYRIETHVEDGEWVPVTFQRYDAEDRAWTSLDRITDVTPLETFRTMESTDMTAQARTGSRPRDDDQ